MAADPHMLTNEQLQSSLDDLTDHMVDVIEENRLLRRRIESLEAIIRDKAIELPPIDHEDHNEVGC